MRWRLCGFALVSVVWMAVCVGSSTQNMHCLPADGGFPDNTTLGGCPACRLRSEVKEMSIAAYKERILSKLGYVTALNITGRILPKVPPEMMVNYEREKRKSAESEMMSDQPNRYSVFEEEDYHAKTEKIFVFHRKTLKATANVAFDKCAMCMIPK